MASAMQQIAKPLSPKTPRQLHPHSQHRHQEKFIFDNEQKTGNLHSQGWYILNRPQVVHFE